MVKYTSGFKLPAKLGVFKSEPRLSPTKNMNSHLNPVLHTAMVLGK